MQVGVNEGFNLGSIFIEKLQIKKLKVYKKSKKWEIIATPICEIDEDEINQIQKSIKEEFDLNVVSILLEDIPTCLSVCELKKQWEGLLNLVFEKYPGLVGFLKDSQYEFSGESVIITTINKSCADYLKLRKIEQVLEEFIIRLYKLKLKVILEYKEESINEEDYFNNFSAIEDEIIIDTFKKAKSHKKGSSSENNSNNIILGRNFNDTPVKIIDINEESGRVTIEGRIFAVDFKLLNNGKSIIVFNITDNTNSITAKIFVKEDVNLNTLKQNIINDKYVRVKGDIQFDSYLKEPVIFPQNILETNKSKRTDKSEMKRIELHAHTNMSSMDGICSAKDLIKRANEWGHKAIAITDHGVVQSFPEAYENGKKLGIKIIYGIEGYFVNDGIPIVANLNKRSLDEDFIVFDIETTGLSPQNDRITEIGAVKIKNGEIIETFSELINPKISIPDNIQKLTGITNNMVFNKPLIKEILPKFVEFIGDCPLVAHNAPFDWGFINYNAQKLGIKIANSVIDTLQLSRILLPQLKKHKLNIICEHLNIKLENHHRASDDATATAFMFINFIEKLKEKNLTDIEHINSIGSSATNYKNADSHHIIILVKNYIGLKNLYKIVSISHLDHFYKKPRILKSVLNQHREGLIIGSACEAGEIYKTLLSNDDDTNVIDKAKYYDYFEIQPVENNEFLVRNGKVKNIEELRNINKRIVRLGEKLNKPVIATGDVHFLDPDDEVYRRILMSGQGYSDADDQAPLYLKTTEEMLDEFSYLGESKSYEVVVENPNNIVNQIEDIKPVPEETFTPKIEGAEEQIKEMTLNKAHAIYGSPLPEIVESRLNKELNSIINNGYAVMYLIAQKLVCKSLKDGYLVGSRGSVGSSFVATMTDITEVNPLPPHYVCPECKFSQFFIEGDVGSGADLKDEKCPKCGTELRKDGHDIPFEVFLGFDGDKEPDIDLNFAGEYQSEAHKYTEELFGKGHVFRAGTIGTLAEKTAFGFVKKYFEKKNEKINSAEVSRLVSGCTGIKRSTGQHPGGVMIVPADNDIYQFTPIQRPADDTDSHVITTHFDYHSISGRLLKLDILGHDVPTIIKMLEDITGFSALKIKLDNQETMSLFTSTKSISIDLGVIDCQVGSLGIPEFGTKFVRQMLMDTKPTTFEELVRISGLSHGTDVWLNNAQDIIKNNTATLKNVISTRDDIMLFLIYKKVNSKTAFKIMENVRKGKGLTEELEDVMRGQDIPEWYIESCKKIKYMFPKAHAVAYVMMSFRIAYYKVHYPEAFYATYFTIKIEDFDADTFVKGKEIVLSKWIELNKKGNNATTKEKNQITLLEVVFEMYQRNMKLLSVDLYRSSADKFVITNSGILPPLNALQGLGINAAQNIVKAREESLFISMDELRERAKLSRTVIDILRIHGCLENMPENSQLCLF